MKFFKTLKGKKLKLPLFFPDATRAVVRSLDSGDIENTQTKGILVNTYHLYRDLGEKNIGRFDGISQIMDWKGAIISDSGGFQVMSIVKSKDGNGKVTDEGVEFFPTRKKKAIFNPEKSIEIQLLMKTDMIVALDDFTQPTDDYEAAKETVDRTLYWAKRSKKIFDKKTKGINSYDKPYLVGVIQGGKHQKLRKLCAEKLAELGYKSFGYGGWPLRQTQGKPDEWKFDYESAKTISESIKKYEILWGLGIGKPQEIVGCHKLGFNVFDCVLPTRDARHGRLYVYNADSIDKIDVTKKDFYSFYTASKVINLKDKSCVSKACDCLLCRRYTKAYLAHLFKINDTSAYRLATIHNLRFYSILMEKLKERSG